MPTWCRHPLGSIPLRMGVAPNNPPRDDHRVPPWLAGNICPQGRARVCIWHTNLALFGTAHTCLALVVGHASSHDVMGFEGWQSKVQLIRLDWAEGQTKNTCASGSKWWLIWSLGAPWPWQDDCWQGLVVDLSTCPPTLGDICPQGGARVHIWDTNPALFGTSTHTCLALVVGHASSHDIMGFEGWQSEVQSIRLDCP